MNVKFYDIVYLDNPAVAIGYHANHMYHNLAISCTPLVSQTSIYSETPPLYVQQMVFCSGNNPPLLECYDILWTFFVDNMALNAGREADLRLILEEGIVGGIHCILDV